MNGAAVAAHAALLLLTPLAGLATARSEPSRLAWPLSGLAALTCVSAASAGSPARAILGIAIALSAEGLSGGGFAMASAVAAGAFVSLVAGLAIGTSRYAGYTVYAVATGLLVLAPAVVHVRSGRAPDRIALATAVVAVAAPLLDFAGRWASHAPWATLPHALALVTLVVLRQTPRGVDQALTARLERVERELGFARGAGAVAIVAAAAVHELKNLLADLRIAAQFGVSSADPAAKDRALLLIGETLSDGRGRALRLLEDLQRGEREAPAAWSAREMLEAVGRSSREALPGGAPEILVDAPVDLLITARRGEIELALSCLARNALAASSQRGRAEVTLRATATAPAVEIEVIDAAGGLPLDLRAGAFEAPATPREGLGLLLAARLAEQNGGRLDYLSAEGRSCFRVSLPGRVDAGQDALV